MEPDPTASCAGAATLGAALGRDGAFPARFDRGSVAGEVPRRSLVVVSAQSFVTLFAVLFTGFGTRPLVLLTAGLFVTVYAIWRRRGPAVAAPGQQGPPGGGAVRAVPGPPIHRRAGRHHPGPLPVRRRGGQTTQPRRPGQIDVPPGDHHRP
ncbi:hypothetical protein GA0115240_1352101 [Streptomyces sp. DvalAA-14]|uniref:APC family permease n=1 Tax=unclassified Streptomyces TaxID=2593676 RepID=UPI00081BC467|nr:MULTISPECIES: APC family permease [unclassified Streptomyces]SCE02062.1 hypothetical protein GA0115240_1352101 [Streptomyces sp. DvalAA-14]